MCVGSLSGVTYLRCTVLTSSNKSKIAVHCCYPALSVPVMLVSRNVFHVLSALQSIAKSFWNNFTKWYNAICRENIALEQSKIVYGVSRYTSSCLTLNHLIIIRKYFLYIDGVHDEKRPQFTDFVTLVNEKVEFENFIAIKTNKPLSFNKKWSNFPSNK